MRYLVDESNPHQRAQWRVGEPGRAPSADARDSPPSGDMMRRSIAVRAAETAAGGPQTRTACAQRDGNWHDTMNQRRRHREPTKNIGRKRRTGTTGHETDKQIYPDASNITAHANVMKATRDGDKRQRARTSSSKTTLTPTPGQREMMPWMVPPPRPTIAAAPHTRDET